MNIKTHTLSLILNIKFMAVLIQTISNKAQLKGVLNARENY